MSTHTLLKPGMEPFPGYRLFRLLGRGGFGEVWESEYTGGSNVALKFLICRDNLSTAREIKSLQAIRLLEHPNLLRMDRVWCFAGYIVVHMELAEGSLMDLLEAYETEFKSPIFPEKVCLYLAQVAEALDFLNQRQHMIDGKRVAIQHCDIKPGNMLLFNETVKVADFGLSSMVTTSLQFHRRSGTLDYMAPEVFQGKLSDRTDQYALAVSYCQLRGGRLPFSDTPEAITPKYQRPDPDLRMMSEAERPIIARALARAPQDRWPTCGGLIGALMRQVT